MAAPTWAAFIPYYARFERRSKQYINRFIERVCAYRDRRFSRRFLAKSYLANHLRFAANQLFKLQIPIS